MSDDQIRFLSVTVMFALVFASYWANMIFRARAMRALAARRGLRYLGPPRPKWGGLPKIKPRIPLVRNWYPANEIRQVWNVIEGEQDDVPILIFDSVFGPFGMNTYEFCTFLACKAQENPFEKDRRGEHTVRTREWRVLYCSRYWYGNFRYWTLSIPRLERQLDLVRRPQVQQ